MDKMKANHEQAYFNTPDYLKGNTALHYAVQLDHEAIVTELLKEGGDIQLKNNFREGKLQPIAYAKNEKMLTLLQGSNDDHSINSGYCTTYVENSGDNSKQHHCLKSADYFLQKKYNVQGALFHYLLAGKTAKVIDLSKNNKFISNCYVCDGGYIDIAHAYLLQDNKRKAHEYYKMAFNVDDGSSDQQEYWQKEINDKVMNKIAIMEKLHMGFTEKATALWQEVLDQQVSD